MWSFMRHTSLVRQTIITIEPVAMSRQITEIYWLFSKSWRDPLRQDGWVLCRQTGRLWRWLYQLDSEYCSLVMAQAGLWSAVPQARLGLPGLGWHCLGRVTSKPRSGGIRKVAPCSTQTVISLLGWTQHMLGKPGVWNILEIISQTSFYKLGYPELCHTRFYFHLFIEFRVESNQEKKFGMN